MMKTRDTIEELLQAGLEEKLLTLNKNRSSQRLVGVYRGSGFSVGGDTNRKFLTLKVNSQSDQVNVLCNAFSVYMSSEPFTSYLENGN